MQNSIVVFTLLCYRLERPFLANLAQKMKISEYFEYIKFDHDDDDDDDDDQFFLF